MTPRTTGRALVLLPDGSYWATISIAGELVHAEHVERRIGDYRKSLPDRVWPVRRIVEIRWVEAEVTA